MLIKIVTENAEQSFIDELKELHGTKLNSNIMHCNFSQIKLKPKPEKLLEIFKDILIGKEAKMFFAYDGDVFIKWEGSAGSTVNDINTKLSNVLITKFNIEKTKELFQYYDFNVHGEDLRLKCMEKIKAKKISEVARDKPLSITEGQKQDLEAQIKKRPARDKLEILVVEDMPFSLKLLKRALSKKYVCHIAEDIWPALEEYVLHAPDICFLDVELPNGNGHALAEFIQSIDPACYIVMVTANNYARDVEIARKNKVKGFVVKPYNLSRIYKYIDNYFVDIGKKVN